MTRNLIPVETPVTTVTLDELTKQIEFVSKALYLAQEDESLQSMLYLSLTKNLLTRVKNNLQTEGGCIITLKATTKGDSWPACKLS